MAAPLVVCWGEVLWDAFPEAELLGGAPANLAHHVAALGGRSALVSAVGADQRGAEAIRLLNQAGVDTCAILRLQGQKTGTVAVELGVGGPRYWIATDVAWDLIAWSTPFEGLVEQARVLAFGTLAQRTASARAELSRVLERVPASAFCFCDLNLRPPFVSRAVVAESLARANVVKLNVRECETLLDMFSLKLRRGTTSAAHDVIDTVTAWLLAAHGIDLVVVTRGADGSVLATKGERSEHPGVPRNVQAGDPVGAGDAFAAVVACELAASGQVPAGAALRALNERANGYASGVAAVRGAMPSR